MKFRAFVTAVTMSPLALAQDGDATVFGTVVNEQDKRPLQFVTVTIQGEGENPSAFAGLTDERGYFEITGLPDGNYSVALTLRGYEAGEADILVFSANDNYDLGDISLMVSAESVEEITVTGQQADSTPTLDSRVYNLEDNLAQSTGSLADVMRTLPGVTVEQDGRIQLRGSDRVVILIDGRQSSLTGFGNQAGLDTIPAAGIASVEIINNPSSQYDATGMAGVINITYREQDQEGLSGDFGLIYGIGQLTKRKDDLPTELGSFDTNPKIIPSANLTYRTGPFRYFLNTQVLKQEDLPNNEFTTRFYDDGRITYSQVPENRKQIQGIMNGGMDWNIDENNLLTLSSILDYESHQDNAQVPFIDGVTMERYRFWFWREEEDTGYLNVNTNFEHQFREPGHQISASVQYTVGREDEDYFLNDRSALRNASDSTHLKATEHTLPLQIDYVKPLRIGRFELGAKLQQRWIDVTYDVVRGEDTIIYDGLGDWSEWGEDVYAAYANLVIETRQWGIEGGMRVEQTDVHYDLPEENIYYPGNDSYDYFKAYPNFRVSYNIDDSSKIAAYYNSRVDRPGEAELRIFPKYDDPEILKVGNPYLRPQFTNSVELAWEEAWNTGSLILAVYYRSIEDTFLRIFDIDDSDPQYNIINRIYQNVGESSNRGIELVMTQDIRDFWEFSGSVNWYRNEVEEYQTQILFPTVRPLTISASSDDTWNLNLNNQISLPWNMRLQFSYTYYAPKNYSQGRESARSSLDFGISKPVFGDKAELALTLTDLMNRFGTRQEIEGNGFNAVYENFYETQVVSLGIKYTM